MTTHYAPASPAPTSGDVPLDELTRRLAGPLGDSLLAWGDRHCHAPTTPEAYPDSPELLLAEVDNRELIRYVRAAAGARGETYSTGPADAHVRWTRVEEALTHELATRVEALTDNEGPF